MTEPAAVDWSRNDREGADDTPGQEWVVLVVDDEPGIHEVTELLLSGVEFDDLPVVLCSAYSAADAKEFLRSRPDTALILLDVVMETDDAGLRLAREIRDEMGNDEVQIVLRTGQPGQAPEREVILNYDINGYFLKTEVTAKKLYSIVISALRTYRHICTLKRRQDRSASRGSSARSLPENLQAEVRGLLSDALDRGGIELSAIPRLDLLRDEYVGFELAASWKSEQAPAICQDNLLATTEETGLATRFAEWQLHRACEIARDWKRAGIDGLRVGLKLPPAVLSGPGLVSAMERLLGEFGLEPATVELDVPEPVIMTEAETLTRTIGALRATGVGISVSGFGEGTASFTRLRRLNPTCLRMAPSLVHNVARDADRSAIVRSIIALAHTLGMQAAATGVSSREDLEFLRWEECEIGQGDIISSALAPRDVPAFVRSASGTGKR